VQGRGKKSLTFDPNKLFISPSQGIEIHHEKPSVYRDGGRRKETDNKKRFSHRREKKSLPISTTAWEKGERGGRKKRRRQHGTNQKTIFTRATFSHFSTRQATKSAPITKALSTGKGEEETGRRNPSCPAQPRKRLFRPPSLLA
jgi:hypothetical protein